MSHASKVYKCICTHAHVLYSLFIPKTALWRFHATRPWPGSLDFRWGVLVWGLSFETAKLFSVWQFLT